MKPLPATPYEYALFADDYPNAYYRDVSRMRLLGQIATGRAREIRRIGKVALYRIQP